MSSVMDEGMEVKEKFGSKSFFFETASGYTVAALATRISSMRDQTSGVSMEKFEEIDLAGLPTKNLRLVNDREYGRHFESKTEVYQAENGDW